MDTGKFRSFIRDMIAALFAGAFFFWFVLDSASLHVQCELQNDSTYSCKATHEVLGLGITSVNVNQVVEIKEITRCSGSAQDRRCAYIPTFKTITGDEVEMSNKYTSNINKVDTLVQTTNKAIKSKEPVVDYTGAGGWVGFQICQLSIAPIIFLLAIFKLFKKPSTGPRTLISWKRNQDSP